jgi:hypothetical protein
MLMSNPFMVSILMLVCDQQQDAMLITLNFRDSHGGRLDPAVQIQSCHPIPCKLLTLTLTQFVLGKLLMLTLVGNAMSFHPVLYQPL